MQTTRSRKLSYLFITPENILEIAEFLFQEHAQSSDEYKTYEVKLYCINDITYEFTETDYKREYLLEKLKTRKATSVSITSRDRQKYIEVEIQHSTSNDNYRKSLTIRGVDEKWVNGTFEQLNEIIGNFKEQKKLVSENLLEQFIIWYFLLPIFTAINIAFLLFKFIPASQTVSGVGIVFSIILANFLTWPILDAVRNLYPYIELATGPEHLQTENKRRKKLIFIVTVIILPFALNLITNFLK